MKKQNKGGIVTTLIVIIAVLIIIAAIYIYRANHEQVSTTGTTPPTTGTQTPPATSTTTPFSVTGMQQYTDTTLGFSFWYPASWQVTDVTSSTNVPFGAQIKNGTIVRKLSLASAADQWNIIIEEVHSPTLTITDTGGAGPIGPVTYFFDPSLHTWMTVGRAGENGVPEATTTADVSVSTMGGLHMLSGTSRFDTSIIPLSAENFLVISDGGASNATVLAKTVVATDPTVATPVSIPEQIQIIQSEESTLASESNG